jgi:hypothetical protein
MRDFEEKPYSSDEQRVAKWLSEKGVGGGDDPVGYLMVAHDYLVGERNRLIHDLERALSKAEQERIARDAKWEAERLRVKALEDAFGAVPDGPEKAALLSVMTDRVVELYNNVRMTEGDAILEFMPNDYAQALLDWYFNEDPNAIFTPPPPPAEHEAAQPGQVQGGPQAGGGSDGLRCIEADPEQKACRLSFVAPQPAGADDDESRTADIVAIAGDLVALWQSPAIQGLPRAERNAAIEETRNRLISAVGAR